jgi:hypothetical protein
MSENDSLKVDKLTFFKFYIDYGTSISNNDDLGILISLLNGNARLGNRLVACVDSLGQPNDAVLLCEVQSHLKLVNWPLLLVNLNNPGVLKVTEHLVVNILRRPIEVAKLTLHN